MNNQEMTRIRNLREQGKTYVEIGRVMGLSVNTVKAHFRRQMAKENLCRNCGEPLVQLAKRKRRSFCGDRCRSAWWKNHRDKINKRAYYSVVCRHCGRHFDSYGNKHRKYCCHRCYIDKRFGSHERGVP